MKHSIGLIGLALVGLAACQQQEPAAAPLAAPPPAEPVAAAPAPARTGRGAEARGAAARDRRRAQQVVQGLLGVNSTARTGPSSQGCYAENATQRAGRHGHAAAGRSRRTSSTRTPRCSPPRFRISRASSELTLVSGNDILSVVLLEGHAQGRRCRVRRARSRRPTRRLATWRCSTCRPRPDGRSVAKERFIYDGGTFMSQLGLSPDAGAQGARARLGRQAVADQQR